MRPTTLFVVSNIQHLLLAQVVAYSVPGIKTLVIWHMPNCGNVVPAMRQIMLDDLWEVVVILPEGSVTAYSPHNFALSIAKHRLLKIRAAALREQHNIDDALKPVEGFSCLYICNPTGVIDRRIWSIASKRRVPVYAIEDGLKSYLSSGIYERDKRSPLRKILAEVWRYCAHTGLDRFAFAYALPFSSKEPLKGIHLLFPAAASGSCRAAGPILDLRAELGNGAFSKMLTKVNELVGRAEIPVGAWLYLNRPDSEDGLLSEELEVSVVSGLLVEIMKAKECQIFLKPHPRDRAEKIRAILERTPGLKLLNLDTPLPIELIAGSLHFSAYIGTWCAPLVYLPLLHQVKTYALLPVFIERAKAAGHVSDRLTEILGGVRSAFRDDTSWLDRAAWKELLK